MPMELTYFTPSDLLQPYIKHYYVFRSQTAHTFEDVVYPSGGMELIFNLAEGIWETAANDGLLFNATPPVECWGQITKPLQIRSTGKHLMLGIRFRTHAASAFLAGNLHELNDGVTDAADLLGKSVLTLHDQLLHTQDTEQRIQLTDRFLQQRLLQTKKTAGNTDKVAHILNTIRQLRPDNSISHIAKQYGMSPRYLHKLVYHHTGLSPVSFSKIIRFQQSLQLISKHNSSLTAIAYDCGYFDQAHFIRDFRSFTGITPGAYLKQLTPVNQLLLS